MGIKLETTISLTSSFSVLPFIRTLDKYYPDIEHWYINKVVPGLILGTDKLIIAKDNNLITGIALGKRDLDETKLRCVRVLPEYQNSGLGIKLIDTMLDLLEEEKPGVTVAEELFHQYSRIFVSRYGFALTDVNKGRYRKHKLEYAFNNA
ncbi:acetyltransferase [Kosakonia phage Kc263]|uniref:Acetyltransferase GNAT family n=1 Tax=Kosakonia phage Kc263 TaxID=2863194 RepID=A0AAE8BEH6_9CAUD|nr:acetyltransferase [Kosakonia phage Kc263]QYN79896.1 acetyltransferase GNAT family [Kosakonia phage Kc263]